VRRLSEDAEKAGRLVAALKLHGGTLALSWLNLLEFTKVRNTDQTRQAESLIEAILPLVFFLEVDPFVVIRRENKLLVGGPLTGPPHADQDLLREFMRLKPTALKLFTANELFRIAQDSNLVQCFEKMAETGVTQIETMREELETDPEFQSALRRPANGPHIQRGTRILLRELLRTFLIDMGVKVTRNHVTDLFHAVVPLAYCDLVLLDKHWETQVNRVRSRLEAAGLSVPVAAVFSGKANGVDRFISQLESI